MLYQITFTAQYAEAGEEPKNVKKVAYVEATSTTEAEANLLKVLTDTRKDLGYSSITVNSISGSPVKAVHFDDSKNDTFFKIRVGYKNDETKKFQYEQQIYQANDLLNAVAKAKSVADESAVETELYNATITQNLVVKELVGEVAM